jgi:signal transduction histidine kinase
MNLFTENSKGLGLKSLKARIILLKANINYNKDINSSSITLTVPLNPNKLV